jgi:gliding motility-associated-like protein
LEYISRVITYIAGIKTFHYFKVFNRYGKLLFETKDPDAGWSGSFNGEAQPMSIYLWMAEGIAADGTLVQKKGETLLLR